MKRERGQYHRVKCHQCGTLVSFTEVGRMKPKKLARMRAEIQFRRTFMRDHGGYPPKGFSLRAIGKRYGLTQSQVAHAEKTML